MSCEALRNAAQYGEYEKVVALCRELGDAGILLNEPGGKSKQQWTALHGASSRGHLAIVELLCREYDVRGHAINEADQYGYTPLHIAAGWGHTEIVIYLCKKYNETYIPLNEKNWENATAIHEAAKWWYHATVEALCKEFNAKGLLCNEKTRSWQTALHVSILHSSVDRGAEITETAKRHTCLETVRTLCAQFSAQHLPLGEKDNLGDNVPHVAAKLCYPKVMDLVCREVGLNSNDVLLKDRNFNRSALREATSWCHEPFSEPGGCDDNINMTWATQMRWFSEGFFLLSRLCILQGYTSGWGQF